MKFRKQLKQRLINHVVYIFTLKAVTDPTILNWAYSPMDPGAVVIKLVRGLMPNRTKPRFLYYDANPSHYPGYGGRIIVGSKEISVVRNDRLSPFNIMEANLVPKRLREEYYRDRNDIQDTLEMLGINATVVGYDPIKHGKTHMFRNSHSPTPGLHPTDSVGPGNILRKHIFGSKPKFISRAVITSTDGVGHEV